MTSLFGCYIIVRTFGPAASGTAIRRNLRGQLRWGATSGTYLTGDYSTHT